MRAHLAAVGGILLMALMAGCAPGMDPRPTDPGIVCTAIAVSALNVSVRDAATGVGLCDATVVAVESSGTSHALRQTGDCRYAGAEERSGEFEVIAARPGYEAFRVTGVRVGRDECHVIPVAVTVDLRPAP